MPPSSSSPAFPPLLSPDAANPPDKTWEARAVFAAVSTAAVITSEDEDGEIDVGKVRIQRRRFVKIL